MVKLRDAYYCNLKLFLIFLVVFGHLIEPQIGADPVLYRLYRDIYLFHMPLFAFLSGLFLKDAVGCLRQLKRMFPLYLLCQAIAVALGHGPWHTPWWVLWYLLSLSGWLAASALFLRWGCGKWLVLAAAVAAGCLAGQVGWIGRPFSLSRSIVFFPYFWLGVCLEPGIRWERFRVPGLLALLLRPDVGAVTLYQAGACDPVVRLECYGFALALGLLVLSWCPRRRFPWTRAGADTMAAYLLHGPVAAALRPVPCPALAACLFLYITHKALRWFGAYGIIGREEGPWPDSKSCTTPTENRSTGSCCP